jgi:proline racemase
MIRLKTIDAHAAGEPLRLVVDGFPAPRGRTMLARRDWLRAHADRLRRVLMCEPRGHADMYGAVLTEPASPGAHAGLLFMHTGGFETMSLHGVIAATTIALERGLIVAGSPRARSAPPGLGDAHVGRTRAETADDGVSIVFDTPAGAVRARARIAGDRPDTRVESVACLNVPSFVLHPGVTVRAAGRQVRADVAFGGAFYAIVDAEATGLPLDGAHVPELRRTGVEIARAIETAHPVVHPLAPELAGLCGTIFTGPPESAGADLRNVIVFAGPQVDRSPGGSGTAAVMAVVDAMGLMPLEGTFVHESLIGTRFTGRLTARTTVGDLEAIVPEIEGSAWITGEHLFLVDEDDPLAEGFRL